MIFQKQLIKSLETNSLKTAIEYNDKKISYGSLLIDANKITGFLLSKKLEKETVIGIELSNRADLICSIIGVVNARCVFVLLDRSLPVARMDHLIKELDLQYVITSEETNLSLAAAPLKGHWKYRDIQQKDQSEEWIYPDFESDDSLYIYFTSGSTGMPKGIIGRNCSLLQFLNWEIGAFTVDEKSRFSQFISPYFDAFLRDVFAPLLAGGTVCIPPNKEDFLTSESIISWIDKARVSIIHCVPSLFRIINQNSLTSENFKDLKQVLMSGEKINPSELINWYRIFDDKIQLVNLYGTTETTMIRTYYKIRPEDVKRSRMPIGVPIADTEILIAKKDMQACGALVPGDLYIISNYLTKGYLNQPELTKEKFIKLNEGTANETIAYKTGDKARRLAGGQIELLGREDRQVKLRGIRIELDEVELMLMKSGLLSNAIVILHTEVKDQESLIAFLIKKDKTVANAELQQAILYFAQSSIPAYMMPSDMVFVEEYPLLPNGKINLKGLLNYLAPEQEIALPANATEERILAIWKEILGDKEISTDDSFQRIGGNSLSLMSLIARINREFKIRISLSELFKNPTIQKQAAFILNNSNESTETDGIITIPVASKADHYVLSSAQKRLFFLYKFDPSTLAYNMPSVFKLEGELSKEYIQSVFEKLISHHEVLRTSFQLVDGNPVQRIAGQVTFKLESFKAQKQNAPHIIKNFIRPFDLAEPCLLRAGLIETNLNEHLLMVDFHHIIMDGVSQELLIKEFMSFYNGEHVPTPKLSYKDFATWQQTEAQQKKTIRQGKFWFREFSELPEALHLPIDYVRPALKDHAGDSLLFEIDSEQTTKLTSIANQEEATMFMVMLSAFNILMARLSNQEDVVMGTPIAGRQLPEAETMLGMFVNTLCLRSRPEGSLSFKEYLSQVRRNTLTCLENQDYPYEELIEILKLERDTSRNPLFDVMFSYQNYQQTKLEIPGFILSKVPDGQTISKFDLTLFVYEVEGGMQLSLQYATSLFKRGTIERFVEYFRQIISAITTNINIRLADIEILSQEEKNRLLKSFNDTRSKSSDEATILEAFEKTVSNHRRKTALVFKGGKTSYRELDEISNQLANRLVRQLGKEGRFVGILMERSPELIVSILGVLKAGYAYIPIDPEYPLERIKHIARDSGLGILLTSSTTQSIRDRLAGAVTSITVTFDSLVSESNKSPKRSTTASDLAYIIYTSGSTGQPKGVMISHASLFNYISWAAKQYTNGQKADFALYSSIAFDLTITSVFTPLFTGSQIIIYHDEENPSLIEEVLVSDLANVVKLTPTHLRIIRDSQLTGVNIKNLNKLIVGGEELSYNLARDVYEKLDRKVAIYNEYGPTETTVGCMIYRFDPSEEKMAVPIGVPIANTQIYVLDASFNLVPFGVQGELYVAGVGVANGYIHAKDLTQQKFLTDPFTLGQTMYKTGDLATINVNGIAEFRGRADEQVKIRGFRIELGEVENQLASHDQIAETVVVVKSRGENKFLTAYYLSEEKLSPAVLRAFLSEKLPIYMIPSFFVNLDRFPLTPNGKLDKKALPDPEIERRDGFVTALSVTEEKLVAIWSETLEVPKDSISINHSFFELGGHSLLAIKLMGLIQDEFGVNLGLPTFFKDPSIAAIAEKVEQGTGGTENLPELTIELENRYEPFPLTSVQQAYLMGRKDVFEYGNVGTHLYTESFLLDLDIDQFNRVLQRLIERHEMLRMIITPQGQQRILEKVPPYKVRILDLNKFSEKEGEELFYKQRNELSHQVFSGEEWPLFDIRVTKFRDGTYKTHYSVDALMLDAGSAIILRNEFEELSRDINAQLPSIPISFRDYVLSEEGLKGSALFEKSKKYWMSRVEDMPFAPDLPLVPIEKQQENPKFERHISSLDKAEWNSLQDRGRSLGLTPTVLLIGCFSEVLNRWSKSSHFSINLTLFNRIPFHKEVNRIVGDFTSLTLLEVDFRRAEDFVTRLQGIQNRLWEDLEHKYFGGVEMLREMSRYHGHSVIIPVVVTSTLGLNEEPELDDSILETFERNAMQEPHSITQTPQVFIDFQLGEDKKGLWFLWDSIEGIFPAGMVDDMFAAFELLLKTLINDEGSWQASSLVSLPLQQQEARALVNDTGSPRSERYLHELFADQVKKTPDRIALITDDKQFTYSELNTMSLALGTQLRALGTVPNRLVAIVMEKGWEQVVASLGILYSGAAYLPIGAELPEERIITLLEQGEADIVVSTASVTERLDLPEGKTVVLVDESFKEVKGLTSLEPVQQLNDLAYVIFTSGSSGMPKGVMIDHVGAVNTITDISARFNVRQEDRVLAISSLSFDLSVYDIFGLLAVGGALVMPRQDELRSPDRWMEYVLNHRVTLWNTVPALMQMLIDYNRDSTQLSLRLVMMSGDWVPLTLSDRIKTVCPKVEVYSLGGATEASIWSIFYPIKEVQGHWKSIPYGKPLTNQGWHVLKPDLTHCPDYVPGDLYITGIGLAKGYWKDGVKTTASFITHPETKERLYKTGDLGRYLSDGNIEFLGREDNQVKIQGFRIELGEIEYQMNNHPEVKEVVVLAKEDKGEKYLVAYYQSARQIEEETFGDFLSKTLPFYMVPSYYVHLEQFPLTPNGKVSLKLLPEPEIQVRPDYLAPTNETQQKLIAIWSELLGVEEEVIGINRSFFELGGHSLKAMEMVNKIREELGVEIPLRVVFEERDIQNITAAITEAEKTVFTTIGKALPRDFYPLSSVQKRLYFLYELDKSSMAYNNPYTLRFKGVLDKDKLKKVFRQLVARHEALRTSFEVVNDEPVQKISTEVFFEIEHISGKEEGAIELIDNFKKPFDLARAPLMRIGLIELKPEDHIMIVDTHHIITDGISQGVLIQDFMKLYQGESLPEVAVHYKDYVEWQQSEVQQQAIAAQKEFWVERFNEDIPALELPTDFVRPAIKSFVGNTIQFDLEQSEVSGLRTLSNQENVTLFMVMLAIYKILLSKLSGQVGITVGISLAGRRHADVENMIGMFANALPLRSHMDGDLRFKDFLAQLKSNSINFFDNQDYPYEQLIEDLGLERNMSRNPLFDTLFFYQNYQEFALSIPGVEIDTFKSEHPISKFDLSLSIFEAGDSISMNFEYATTLFKKETIDKFITWFKRVVNVVLANSEVKIKDIDLMSVYEREQVLVVFNDTGINFPTDKSYIDLFEEQVSRTPDEIAACYEGKELTYQGLDQRSTDLALTLTSEHTAAAVVGLLVEPSFEMLIGLLGILKSGKAFLPLDPKQPESRLTDIIEDISCEVIVTTQQLSESLVFKGNKLIVDSSKTIYKPDSFSSRANPNELAYVIYTSGSTGKPKGVQIMHGNLVNYVLSLGERLALKPGDKSILTSSFFFDLGYSSIFAPLVHGASVHLVDKSLYLSPEDLLTYIEEHDISYLKITPSLLKTIVNASNFHKSAFHKVKQVVIGGEALILDDVAEVLRHFPDVLFIDEYGPTETTVGVIMQPVEDIESLRRQPSIGKPISNTKVFILDSYDMPVPQGVIGELCIAGAAVGSGYVNKPELTAEKFISLPIHHDSKIYKTGDLARWLPDGRIAFLGRTDNQVKIKGYRIEPDEIATCLRHHEAVRDAAVIVRQEEDNKVLLAYFVADTRLDEEILRDFLKAQLPEYMIPAQFIGIDVLPLTPNGKLDTRALPAPTKVESIALVAPQTEEEQLLIDVWLEVLKIEQISTTDNFFSIGGDSIKCILICSKVRSKGYSLTIEDVLTQRTIQNIAKRLKKLTLPSGQEVVQGYAPLTPIQEWFFNGEIKTKYHFNQSVMLEFEQGISTEEIKQIFKKLLSHHDALRTVFKQENSLYKQHVSGNVQLALEVHDLRQQKKPNEHLLAIANAIQSSINLANGPLLKLGLFNMRDADRLLIVIHHLVVDGVSWRVLFEDIESLLRQLKKKEVLTLPAKTDSYQSWSRCLQSYTKTVRFERASRYWDKALTGKYDSLKRDFPEGTNINGKQGQVTFELNEALTSKLLTEVHGRFNTQINDMLLAAFVLGIHEQFGQESVMIDLEGHGRENVHQGENVSRTVGWFTSIYPVVLFRGGDDLSNTIKIVKEILRGVPNNGIDYLLKQYCTNEGKGFGNEHKARIIFNYLGQFDSDIDDKLFKVSQSHTGANRASGETEAYDWDISGMVTGGLLKINLSYSKDQYKTETIESFLENFNNQLTGLIDYCIAEKKAEFTPSDFTYKALSIAQVEELGETYDMVDLYPLSPMQEGMLFHSLLDSESEYYFEQMTCNIKGELNLQVMEDSVNTLLSRYDILRTAFLHEGFEKPIQVVLKERKVDFHFVDVRKELRNKTREEISLHYRALQIARKFDLSSDVLMRIVVLQTEEDEYELLWGYHHILMDGWCMGIITTEFKRIYMAKMNDYKLSLPPAEPFSRYVEWLENRDKEESLEYWKGYLKNYNNTVSLPQKEQISNKNQFNELKAEQILLNRELTISLNHLSEEYGVTINTVIQCAWGILLGRYNRVDDVVFGSVVSGRPSEVEGMEKMVGLFINTVPVRIEMEKEAEVSDLLQETQRAALEGTGYHYTPLSEIQGTTELGKDLISSVVVFENYPVTEQIIDTNEGEKMIGDFDITDVRFHEPTNYGLILFVVPGDEVVVKLDYNGNAFTPVTIKRSLKHLSHILSQIASNARIRLKDIQLMSKQERNRMLYEMNRSEIAVPKTVLDLFNNQVKKTPDNVALRYKEETVSYRELDEQTDKLANYLNKYKGLKPGELVGLIQDRHPRLIISMLAVLKAGAAYLPIEPTNPVERKKLLIANAQCKLVISEKKYIGKLKNVQKGLLDLEETWSEINEQASIPPNVNVSGGDLAYVIYTSGSTGQPKGVMIPHSALLNFINWTAREFTRDHESSFALNSSVAFDLTITVIYTPLVTGNEVVIYQGDEQAAQIVEVLEDDRANVIKLTPTHLKLVKDNGLLKPGMKNLKTLIVAGEEFKYSLAKEVYDKLGGEVSIYNFYGPTEVTVTCLYLQFDPDKVTRAIPIGIPVDNTQIYILDEYFDPVPQGVEGELYLAGEGLAVGYLYEEELTREKFIDNPFMEGKKMYKTGDLVKINEDGHVVFVGRIDHQVKIRGFRIELGEVESHLATHKEVKEVVVAIKEKDDDPYMVAYYQSDNNIEARELVNYLQSKLPDHMIPSFYVHLDEFPVTNNGKLNRKALPEPELDHKNGFIAPSTETEKQMAKIWSNILGVEQDQISVDRSFFEFGGHSLKSIILANTILKEFGAKLSLNDIFTQENIRNLSTFIVSSARSQHLTIPRAVRRPEYPVSQAQIPLYFQHELEPESLIRNLTYVVEIEGDLDKERLQLVFERLIDRHETLRTSFQVNELEPVQVIAESVDFDITHLCTSREEVESAVIDFVKPFDISRAPLMRVGLIQCGPYNHVLMVDVHHLVADGLSLNILKKEFLSLYNDMELPELKVQYSDYVMWQRSKTYQDELARQKEFWLEEFAREIEPLEVPLDYDKPGTIENEGERVAFRIGPDKSKDIKLVAESHGATTAMAILSIFSILLSKLTRQEDIIVGVPLAGREQAELEGVVGMFAKVLPLRSYPKADLSFKEYLSKVKHKFSSALDNQSYPYEDLANELNIKRNSTRNPWFDVMFEYQHFQASNDLVMPDLTLKEFVGKDLLTEQNLSLDVSEQAEEILFGMSYSKALFRRKTVDKFIAYFKQIISSVIEKPDILLSQIEIVEGTEREKLLFEFSGAKRDFNRQKVYSDFFKKQVDKTPNRVAVQHDGQSLTYSQLYERSMELAIYLNSKGVNSDVRVGVYMPRSIDMLVSILGVLRTGSSYVPIDVYYPEQRVEEIAKDSEVCMIISNADHISSLDKVFESTPLLKELLDIGQLPDFKGQNGSMPTFEGGADDLAYIIYTSGTTGKPKGVMIHQLGMINHLFAKIHDLGIGTSDTIAQTASPCFDISVWQLLAALMVGGKTYIIDKEKAVYPNTLFNELQKGKVSVFESVPSLMTNFLDDLPEDHHVLLEKLRWMVPTGEALSAALVKKWYQYFPDIKLLNAYGPTEASDDVTHYVVEPLTEDEHVIPIGKPLANTRIFILNDHLGLCPIGVRGEICVGGLGVGKGYWQNEKKTDEVFVPNPFISEIDDPDYALLYKTGDIGYFREDGNVVCVGRKDDQLKINGNRIELGEIESRLALHKGIREAAVVAKGQGAQKYIAAYYISDEFINSSDLKIYLIDQLPDYMVPAVYERLDKMPLTTNGKLDRSALPELDVKVDEHFVKPGSVTEIKLCAIWSDVLKIDNVLVSVAADFFSMGGNSLMSITLIGKIHKQFNVKISLRDFFDNPTIRATADYIESVLWLTVEKKGNDSSKIEINI